MLPRDGQGSQDEEPSGASAESASHRLSGLHFKNPGDESSERIYDLPSISPGAETDDFLAFETLGLLEGDEVLNVRLGDFQILHEIGRGGMGIVYLARQISLDRQVALKVLPGGIFADKSSIARFHREAQVTAGLHHPNVVEIHAMGVERGTAYYAMEFCPGETLQDILVRLRENRTEDDKPRESPVDSPGDVSPPALPAGFESPGKLTARLPPREDLDGSDLVHCALTGLPDRPTCRAIAKAFVGAAEGLHHAHGHGVIHRDLKPSNLILDPDGRLRVLDFGLAFWEGQGRLTQSKERLGTPYYMSPEQASPESAPLGPPTDVYGLGAALYEVLTFQPPFRGKSREQTLEFIQQRDPVPPRRLNPRVPRSLETITLKCLQKRPSDRYVTAEALAQDLRRFVRGDPVEARPLPLFDRLLQRAWRSRRKILEATTGLALLITLLIIGTQLVHNARERARKEYANDVEWATMRMLRKPLLANAREPSHLRLDELSSPPLEDELELRFTRREGAHREWLEAGSELFEAGLSLADAGPDPVAEAIERLRAAAQRLPDEPVAYYNLAKALRLLGRLREANAEVARALEKKSDFVPALALRATLLQRLESPIGQSAWKSATEAARAQGAWAEAWLDAHRATQEKRWKAATEAFERVLGTRTTGGEPYLGCWLETRLSRGLAFLEAEDIDLALIEFGIARDEAAGSLEPTLLLAKTFHLKGRTEQAERHFEEVSRQDSVENRDDAYRAIAAAYRDLGDPDVALRWIRRMRPEAPRFFLSAELLRDAGLLEEALAAATQAVERDPLEAAGHLARGNALLEIGRLKEARLSYGQAALLAPDDIRPWLGIAMAHEAEGDLESAEGAAVRAVNAQPSSVEARMARARILSKAGRLVEAASRYEEALELEPDHAIILNNLGTVLDRQGLPSSAIRCYQRASAARPDLAFIHFNLALALHRQRIPLAAAEAYREAIARGLDTLTLRSNLAYCLHVGGKLEEAIAEYQEALRFDSKSALLHHSLGVLHDQRYEMSSAIVQYAKAVELDPSWPDAHNELGYALDQVGREDEAIEQYRMVFELEPKSIWAVNNYANLVLRSGRHYGETESPAEEIQRLEDAADLANAHSAVATLLHHYREELLPDLASFASVDWALEGWARLAPCPGSCRVFRLDEPGLEGLDWTRLELDDTAWDGMASAGEQPPEGELSLSSGLRRDSRGSLYVRAHYDLPDAASIRELTLVIRGLDGCVAFVNGTEVARLRAGPRLSEPPDGLATGREYSPWVKQRLSIDPVILNKGDNVLALRVLGAPREGPPPPSSIGLEARYAFDRGGRERAARALASYRAVASGPAAPARIAYFEGRLLQEDGSREAAMAKLLEARELDPGRPEPVLRLAECIAAGDDWAGASRVLHDALASGLERFDSLWDAWIHAALVEEGRPASEILREVPSASVGSRAHASDLLWLLGRLAAEEPLRIRCGGQGVVLEGRGIWSRDRFYRAGTAYQMFKLESIPRPTEDFALYTTERFFYAPTGRTEGYRVPLPRGTYRVTLRFIEGHFVERESRVFDVILEGQTEREAYEPLAKGFGVPDSLDFSVEVKDGILELAFAARIENPKISAFEIEPE